MRISVVSSLYPGRSAGEAINLHVLVQVLGELGHDVEFFRVDVPGRRAQNSPPSDLDCGFTSLAARRSPFSLRYSVWDTDAELTGTLVDHVQRHGAKLVIILGWEVLSLVDTAKLNSVRQIVLLGDPLHAVFLRRLENYIVGHLAGENKVKGIARNIYRMLLTLYTVAKFRLIERRIRKFEWGYATAAHHARFYAGINPNIVYHPSPVLGPGRDDIEEMIEAKARAREVSFLFIGHNLTGTSSTAGMRYLDRVFGMMEQSLGSQRPWKLIIAGQFFNAPDANFEEISSRLMRSDRVEIVGPVDLAQIAGDVSVLINTVPHRLGNRTRIASAFAFGIPAISHVAAVSGMPSLETDGGALLFRTEKEFSRCVKRIAGDRDLYRRLAKEASKSYRKYYSKENLKRVLEQRL